jgi:hypothetical protein
MMSREPTLGAESEIFTVDSEGVGFAPATENLWLFVDFYGARESLPQKKRIRVR